MMRREKISNNEIRRYWQKIIKRSLRLAIEKRELKIGFIGACLVVFILVFLIICVVFGIISPSFLVSQLDSIWINLLGSLVAFIPIAVVLVVFLASLYHTPAELERIQEKDFVSEIKVLQEKINEKEKEISQYKNEIKNWVDKNNIPTSREVAYQTGLLVQEFENFNFVAMSNDRETKNQYLSSRSLLSKILDENLPAIRLLLKNADVIQENLYKLNSILNNYGRTLDDFIGLKEMVQRHQDPIPQHIREQMQEYIGLLWGIDEKSYKPQMKLIVQALLKNLTENVKD